ncbi:glycosyltransferase family 10 domain-containing protein [Chromobacterium paludis]|uniref:Fucosyltransferase C-terminal domain-containing protein n=1 Tax=Chromobacterium paludis TaxID=2605945 RepID=A0A5C1DNN1_9NEIS|nr:glycosyltransferase family 10 [Chromobacterium paludis]QEL57707.1 hypothetical protein FYK34_20130 [Chromobacterium paludis]
MIKILIKHAPNICKEILERQIPDSWGMNWGGVGFTFDESEAYDWVAVMHHSALQERFISRVPKERCIYISMEPCENLCNVSPHFISQFGVVIASDEKIIHPNLIHCNVHTWWVGLSVVINNGRHNLMLNSGKDFNFFENYPEVSQYNKACIISSGKSIFPGHEKRNKFIEEIKKSRIGDLIDIYGHGGMRFDDKLDVIKRYKFCIVVENGRHKGYWSEKLADTFLSGSRPIYYGCPDIHEFFPEKSVLSIDIEKIEGVIEIVDELISGKLKYFDQDGLKTAKERILYKYNFYNLIAEYCQSKDYEEFGEVKLFPNVKFYRGKFYYFLKSTYMKIKKILFR